MKLNTFFLMICAIFSSCGKSDSKRQDQIKYRVQLKVMTYNIHHANPPNVAQLIDVKAIAKVINDAKPDLVALQEIDVFTERSGKELDQAKELAKLTGMHYYFSKAIDYQGGEYGVATLSKYPITNAKGYLLPMKAGINGEQRTIAIVEVELPNKETIVFANTHFDTADHRDLQAEFVLNVLKEFNKPIILAGDFNDLIGSSSISQLSGYFSMTCSGACPRTVMNHPTKVIDHIFYSSNSIFISTKHEVIQEKYASDHLPVLATFELM